MFSGVQPGFISYSVTHAWLHLFPLAPACSALDLRVLCEKGGVSFLFLEATLWQHQDAEKQLYLFLIIPT